ncbi:MAG TPA: hypothetical protein VJM33_18565, partial [Microthrixaceae bacterium]|nr:hypothetical protein [Microthrixaceae bacterium]
LFGQSAVLNNMGGIAYWAGRWDEALALYDRATEASTRAGMVVDAAFGDFGVGEILIDQGQVDLGAARVRRAEQVWRGAGDEHGVAFAAALLARAALRAGEIDDAYQRYERAAAEHTRLHADADAQLARVESFECLLAVGRSEEVLDLVDGLLAQGEGELTFVVPLLRRVRGLALSQMGEVPAGRLALLDATAAAFERSSLFEAARSLDALCAITAAWDPERAGWMASRDAIFEQLGVVVPPRLPDGLRMVGRSRHVYA